MPAYARLLAPAGDGRTSFDHPFPGHPGVSQSRTPQAFHPSGTTTVPSKNGGEVAVPSRDCHGFVVHNLLTTGTGE
jgi:hypothetical protein